MLLFAHTRLRWHTARERPAYVRTPYRPFVSVRANHHAVNRLGTGRLESVFFKVGN